MKTIVPFSQRWLEGFSNFQRQVRGKVSGFTRKIFCGPPDIRYTGKTGQILNCRFPAKLKKNSRQTQEFYQKIKVCNTNFVFFKMKKIFDQKPQLGMYDFSKSI
jgi:hypothetical protein